ncbi:hypothetical protein B296_00035562, partial [Ensete ventricosum]
PSPPPATSTRSSPSPRAKPAPRSSRAASSSPSPSTGPRARDSSPRTSTSSARSTCRSSSFPGTPPAPSLPTIFCKLSVSLDAVVLAKGSEMSAEIPTPSTPTCSPRGRGTGRCSSSSGLIPPRTSTPTPTILWNPSHIIFMVDGTPIRDFKNLESRGVAFPKNQPMRIYSSLWNADDWATRGGLVKTDWSQAPFTASYRSFRADRVPSSSSGWWSQEKMKWVQKNYMIYNYCSDLKRFPQGLPTECSIA